MSKDSGNDLYITQALLDIVSDSEVIARDDIFEKLTAYGFSKSRIDQLLDRLNVHSQINLADLPKIGCMELDYRPIAITYPAFDNRGIPAKNPFSRSISSIVESIQDIIYSARNRILILSPYAEEDGLNYLHDMLVMKLKNGVEVKLIVRELDEDTPRRNRLIRWVKDNLAMYDNFSLYNYHYVSNNGHIDSTCHAKVVVADNNYAYVGSGDVRSRAFNLNLEMGTIHKGYIARVVASLISDMSNVSTKYPLR